jgi:hypothetical protein
MVTRLIVDDRGKLVRITANIPEQFALPETSEAITKILLLANSQTLECSEVLDSTTSDPRGLNFQ